MKTLLSIITFLGCQAGTEGNGLVCTECQNSFHPGGQDGVVTCSSCPENTFAPKRSTSMANCTGKFMNGF